MIEILTEWTILWDDDAALQVADALGRDDFGITKPVGMHDRMSDRLYCSRRVLIQTHWTPNEILYWTIKLSQYKWFKSIRVTDADN